MESIPMSISASSPYISLSNESSGTGDVSSSHLFSKSWPEGESQSGLASDEIDDKLDTNANFDNIDLNFAKHMQEVNSRFTKRFGKFFNKINENAQKKKEKDELKRE